VPERLWEEDCEEQGLDYDDEADRFYDECNDLQSILLSECKREVEEK